MTDLIDFSCKHDQFIQNKDGSLSRMDEPYYEVEVVAPGTWKILSSGDHSYLIEGDEEAVAIDTGYGAGNIRSFLQTLTQKPVRDVVNTHEHFDHTANNGYFEKAYMSLAATAEATVPWPSFEGIVFPTDYEKVIVKDQDVIPIRGRELVVIEIPDHAAGSIALLDRTERLLFTGDEFMPMGKNLNGGVASFLRNLEKLMACRKDYDRLCGGIGVFDGEMIDKYYACAKHILAGNEGDPPSFGGRKPMEPKLDANGRVIYDRMMPHPEDFHHSPPDPAYIRCMQYAGAKITYDIRKRDL